MSTTWLSVLQQAGLALLYYGGLLVITRVAGKRLAGQVTTFDLIVLITLGVVLQSTVLREGDTNAVVFIITVFVCHKLLAEMCFRSERLRYLVRGKPRVLVRDGKVQARALYAERMSRDELLAGLRKLGHDSVETVALAVLEETGHISATAIEG